MRVKGDSMKLWLFVLILVVQSVLLLELYTTKKELRYLHRVYDSTVAACSDKWLNSTTPYVINEQPSHN